MSGGFPGAIELCNATSEGATFTSSLNGTQIACGSTVGSYASTWTTLVASAPFDISWIDLCCPGSGYNWSVGGAISLAVGPPGSEQVIAENLIAFDSSALHFPVPCNIPAGTRISVNATPNNITYPANNIPDVQLILFQAGVTSIEGLAGIDSIGWNSATACGTSVDPGGTAATKGVWVELGIASRDYAGFYFFVDTLGFAAGTFSDEQEYIDIAIGPSGSQITIIPNFYNYTTDNGPGWGAQPSMIYWAPIPAGTTVWARAQSTATATPARLIGVTVYGIYK